MKTLTVLTMNVENLLSRVSEWLRRRVASIAKNERVATVTEVSVPAGKGKRQKGGKTLMVQAEEYLWSHYAFRYNVLSGEYEYARLATSKAAEEAPIYATLNAEVRRHLLMQLQREGINIPYISQVQTIIECSRAEQYNPLLHYYGSLPTWDGTDHIGELFRRLTDIPSKCVFTVKDVDESGKYMTYYMYTSTALSGSVNYSADVVLKNVKIH